MIAKITTTINYNNHRTAWNETIKTMSTEFWTNAVFVSASKANQIPM